METVSKKRGRPRLLTETDEGFYRSWYPDQKTRRSWQNKSYLNVALQALQHDGKIPKRFEWVCGGCGPADGSFQGRLRFVVLYELGRLRDAEAICSLAAHLCKEQPSTRRAVAWLRKLRGEYLRDGARFSSGSEEGLFRWLVKAVEDYQEAHVPGVGADEARAAVLKLLAAVKID